MNGMVYETAAALETLYGRCEPQDGEIIFTDEGKKQTKRAFPIGSTKAIVEAADEMNGNCDHYWKVNLMDADAMRERSRRENKGNYLVGNLSEVKTVVCFALDCDAGKGEYLSREKMLGCLARMPQPPTMIINSDGDEGGFHAYWCLAEPYRVGDDRGRDYIAELSKRWQDRLNVLTGGKLDSTADLTRFLRVIGQPRSNGRFVTCHEVHPRRLYSLRDLTISWKPPSKPSRVVRQMVRETLGEGVEAADKPVTAYIDGAMITVESLLLAAGYEALGNDAWRRPNSQSGARSLKLATKLNRPGVNLFSTGDPLFPARGVGQFFSIDEMFVRIRFQNDWRAAAKWCREQIENSKQKVDLSQLDRKVGAA